MGGGFPNKDHHRIDHSKGDLIKVRDGWMYGCMDDDGPYGL